MSIFNFIEMKESKDNTNKIAAKESAYLYISISQLPASGNGLHTAIDVYKEEIIAVFKGEILTDNQAKLRAKKCKDNYFINMPDGSIMDSMKVKCFAKFANDAAGSTSASEHFKNNAVITLDENSKVCLVAIRNINSGEEIFCSYGKRYWEKRR